MDGFMMVAIEEAKKGRDEGGIPIGSVLVHQGKIIGRGTIGECKKAVVYCMARWMRWKTQVGCQHPFISNLSSTPLSALVLCALVLFYSTVFLR